MKQNTKNVWFVNRDYGYGWRPANIYGWLTVGLYVALVLVALSQIEVRITVVGFLLIVFILTIILIIISYIKGTQLEWRWKGKPICDRPDTEDK